MEHLLFTERYRPHKIADAILPAGLKKSFQTYVDDGSVSNLLLAGPPGVGKTTAAMAMLDELGADWMMKNASLEGIDMLRTTIQQFASSMSLAGGRKYVILDEADRMTGPMQEGLRAFIEEFAGNCSFLFTCNDKSRIIPALHSRCAVIDFRIPKAEKATLALQFYQRTLEILKENEIEYDKAVVAELVQKFFPDFRRMLNELQHYSKCGRIGPEVLSSFSDATMKQIVKYLREKSFTAMRKLLAENQDIDFIRFYRQLYDAAYEHFDPKFVPQLVVMMAASMDQMSRSLDPEITLAAFLTDLMINAIWRE
jgi:DNA polymerase III delta prime subunit